MKEELDRVRCSTNKKYNDEIEAKILSSLREYSNKSSEEITKRIHEVEREWSIERTIELNASTLAFIGLLLGAFVNKYWLFIPGLVLPFLFLHAIQGWCPPIPIMRKFHIRTRREMDWEKFGLKFLRGDFDKVNISNTEDLFNKIKQV